MSMSSASARDVAHVILGACAAGVRNVLYRPFMINAKPVCSDRSDSVARSLKATRGPEAREHVAPPTQLRHPESR